MKIKSYIETAYTHILTPKNLNTLKIISHEYQEITFPGLSFNISQINNKEQHRALIRTEKIREYHTIQKTPHSCIIGLGNSVEQLLSLAKRDIEYPLLEDCLSNNYCIDLRNVSLLEAIFDPKSPSLLKAFLILADVQVQAIKENTLVWLQYHQLLQENLEVIPIKIRINLFQKTKHTIYFSKQTYNNLKYPVFERPLILGQTIFDAENEKNIVDIQFLYSFNNLNVNISPQTKRFKGLSYPLSLEIIKKIYDSMPKEKIAKNHLPFVLQSLVSTLSPNLA